MSLVIHARRVAVVAVLVLLGALMVVPAAGAMPVPPSDFTCGVTDFTPCNQTAHFSNLNDFLTPPSPSGATNCPNFVLTDFATVTGTGNGIEHSIINNAGDGWTTSTFTGTVTITPFLDPGLTTPDPNVLPFTGQLTEWFGGSFNRNNFVFHTTFHFSGTDANGNTLRVLDVSHANTTGAAPFGPPNSFEILSCG
jgi:hypothetical protein